jgi:hypothetical protein
MRKKRPSEVVPHRFEGGAQQLDQDKRDGDGLGLALNAMLLRATDEAR